MHAKALDHAQMLALLPTASRKKAVPGSPEHPLPLRNCPQRPWRGAPRNPETPAGLLAAPALSDGELGTDFPKPFDARRVWMSWNP